MNEEKNINEPLNPAFLVGAVTCWCGYLAGFLFEKPKEKLFKI